MTEFERVFSQTDEDAKKAIMQLRQNLRAKKKTTTLY